MWAHAVVVRIACGAKRTRSHRPGCAMLILIDRGPTISTVVNAMFSVCRSPSTGQYQHAAPQAEGPCCPTASWARP